MARHRWKKTHRSQALTVISDIAKALAAIASLIKAIFW